MEYVDFFGHKVSKLICGDNPFNGHSYIPEHVPGEEMVAYHTEEKILEAMHKMEELGINTMLPLSEPYIIRILQHYRNNGGKMNFIFQMYAPMMIGESFEVNMRMMESVDPIGVYIPGSTVDWRYERGEIEEIHLIAKTVREHMNVKLGFGTHHPEVMEYSVENGWDHDFMVACMYDFRRGQLREKSGFLTGKSKSGIQFVESDRELALNALKKVEKPVIAFKLFGGGNLLCDKNEEERRVQLKEIYDTVFSSLKPNDFGAIGVFQKYHDQLTENVSAFNEWAESKK